MIVSGVSGDGLIQAAATLIVGVVFLLVLRQAIAPNKPITRPFIATMLVPVYFWVAAIATAVLTDVVMLGFGWFAPAPTSTVEPEGIQLLAERSLRWALLLLLLGLVAFVHAIIRTSRAAPEWTSLIWKQGEKERKE
jgi:Mg2+/Co2+ transporter CorB